MTIHDRIRAGEFDNKLPLGPGPRGKESLELNKAYRQENYRLMDLFHQALAEEFRMVGHPKELRLFNLVWEAGNSSHERAAHFYENLLELAR